MIVESPSKAKTISKYLGGEYEVLASVGHIKDLPKKELGVDIENDFAITEDILPDKKSTVYTNPIEIRKTTTIRARFYRSDGVMSSVAESTFSRAEPRKYGVRTLNLGVSYRYYEGSWSSLPNFANLKVLKTGISDDFNLTMADKTDGYALAFTGYLDIEEPGLYTFETTSDDGSALFVDRKLIVDNNGIHAPITKSGEVELSKGWKKIEVFFFEGGGGEVLNVKY